MNHLARILSVHFLRLIELQRSLFAINLLRNSQILDPKKALFCAGKRKSAKKCTLEFLAGNLPKPKHFGRSEVGLAEAKSAWSHHDARHFFEEMLHASILGFAFPKTELAGEANSWLEPFFLRPVLRLHRLA